jgi:hypothetical protein
MAKMNWNRPNNGYEREPWQKDWQPTEKKRLTSKAFWNEPVVIKPKAFNYSYPTWKKIKPKMTDEQRKRIQALRIK